MPDLAEMTNQKKARVRLARSNLSGVKKMVERIIHTEPQGSQEWLAKRTQYFTASDANALFNNRAALFEPVQHSDYVKNVIFPNGHRIEAIAREYATKNGISLNPVCMSRGKLWASLDALACDFMGNELYVWECKQWNEKLAESVKNGIVPPTHSPQLIQQLYVTGMKKSVFVVTDGTPEKWEQCEFTATQEDFDKLLAAWDLFEKDKAVYMTTEKINAKDVAEPELNFPVPVIEVRGELLTKDCAAQILAAANEIKNQFSNVVITNTASFTFGQKLCKGLKEFEDKCKIEAESAFASVSDIETAVKTYREAGEVARKLRLDTEKLTKKFEADFNAVNILKMRSALQDYKNSFPQVTFWQPVHDDFEGVVKGMRSTSFDQKIAKWESELARQKLEIKQQVDNHEKNTESLKQLESFKEAFGYDYTNHLTRSPAEFMAEMERRIAELKAKKERERIEGLQREIAAISAYPMQMRGVSDEGLCDKISELQNFETDRFRDLENNVKYAIESTINAINLELSNRAEKERQRLDRVEYEKKLAIERERLRIESESAIKKAQAAPAPQPIILPPDAIFIPQSQPQPTPPAPLTDKEIVFYNAVSKLVADYTGVDLAEAKRRVNSIRGTLSTILE